MKIASTVLLSISLSIVCTGCPLGSGESASSYVCKAWCNPSELNDDSIGVSTRSAKSENAAQQSCFDDYSCDGAGEILHCSCKLGDEDSLPPPKASSGARVDAGESGPYWSSADADPDTSPGGAGHEAMQGSSQGAADPTAVPECAGMNCTQTVVDAMGAREVETACCPGTECTSISSGGSPEGGGDFPTVKQCRIKNGYGCSSNSQCGARHCSSGRCCLDSEATFGCGVAPGDPCQSSDDCRPDLGYACNHGVCGSPCRGQMCGTQCCEQGYHCDSTAGGCVPDGAVTSAASASPGLGAACACSPRNTCTGSGPEILCSYCDAKALCDCALAHVPGCCDPDAPVDVCIMQLQKCSDDAQRTIDDLGGPCP